MKDYKDNRNTKYLDKFFNGWFNLKKITHKVSCDFYFNR